MQKWEQKETLRRTDTHESSNNHGFVCVVSASPGVLADLMVQELVEFDGFGPGSSNASVSESGQNGTQPHAVRRHTAFDRFTQLKHTSETVSGPFGYYVHSCQNLLWPSL